MDPIAHLRKTLDRHGYPERITEEQLIEVLEATSYDHGTDIPDGMDDSNDVHMKLNLLSSSSREKLGLEPRRDSISRTVSRPDDEELFDRDFDERIESTEQTAGSYIFSNLMKSNPSVISPLRSVVNFDNTLLRIRIQAIVCRNDDGLLSNGDSGQSKADIGIGIAKAIDETNKIFKRHPNTNIEFVFYPSADIEVLNQTKYNQDYILPDADLLKFNQLPSGTTKDQRDTFLKPFSTDSDRRSKAKEYPGKLVIFFAEGNRQIWGEPGENNWRFCNKCNGLYFGGHSASICPTGGQHSKLGSGDYSLLTSTPGWPDQHDWKWCGKCKGLFFDGNSNSVCPSGGSHSGINSRHYVLSHNHASNDGQDNWRWCNKCQGLFFAEKGLGVCPAGGQHSSSGSGNYRLLLNKTEQWNLASPSDFAFSGKATEYARLTAIVEPHDAKNYARLLAHELGHYLHLIHTHAGDVKVIIKPGLIIAKNEYAKLEKIVTEKLTKLKSEGVKDHELVNEAFDVDRNETGITDTPADVGPQLFKFLNILKNGGKECGTAGKAKFQLNDGSIYEIAPDRSNVMSYFKHCTNFDHRFSSDQGKLMRDALINQNRRDLVKIQLGDSSTPELAYDGIWNPGKQDQFVAWGRSRSEHHDYYKSMWQAGKKLIQQHAYVVNNKILYDGIWEESSENQYVSWQKTLELHNAEYKKMWNKGMKLIHQQAYIVNNKIFYDGIWNPASQNQYVSWKKPIKEHNTEYKKMWKQGMRLIHQQAYEFDGQIFYDGIWNPANHGQYVSWKKTMAEHNQEYTKMWKQGMRLTHQQAYWIGGQLFFDGIWNPANHSQYVSWHKTREQIHATYDEMWHQGMRLLFMNTYLRN